MKILILGSKEYPMGTNQGDDPQPSGGIEVYVDALVEKLAQERSLEFVIITRKFKNVKEYEKKERIEIYRVGWLRGFYFRNLSFNFLSFMKSSRLDFDIIYSHDLFATLFGIILAKIRKKPQLATIHGTAYNQPQYNRILRFVLGRLEKFVYSKPDYVVSLSENVRENFERAFGFLPEDWEVIPMSIDLKNFEDAAKSQEIRKEFNLGEGTLIVTFVGRLIAVKGAKYLIEAIGEVNGNDFIVLIVGTGPDEEKLKKLVSEKDLNDRIIFTGFREDISDILTVTDIYALPSISEGLSISLLEARAVGCACVVTNIGLPVKDGETALVVPPRDPEKLAAAIKTLLDDEELRERLAKNAKEGVKGYSGEKTVKEHMKLFNRLKI